MYYDIVFHLSRKNIFWWLVWLNEKVRARGYKIHVHDTAVDYLDNFKKLKQTQPSFRIPQY